MIRNALAVILGVSIAFAIIAISITFVADNMGWVRQGLLFDEWRYVLKYFSRLEHNRGVQFFLAALISNGVGSLIGGVVAALIVKSAKQAYSILIGFILFLVALGDVIITPYHPTWYEIAIFPILFFFSWLGGKVVDVLSKKKRNSYIAKQQM